MKNFTFALIVPFAVTLLAGCSGSSSTDSNGSSSDNPQFSCDVHQIQFFDVQRRCATFGSMPSDLRDDNCDTANGDQVVDSCPTDGLIGVCLVANSNFANIEYSYYSNSTLDAAEDNCAGLHGTFNAAP